MMGKTANRYMYIPREKQPSTDVWKHGGRNGPLNTAINARWDKQPSKEGYENTMGKKKKNTLATDNKYAMEEAVLYCPVSLHPLWGKVALSVSTGI